MKQEREYQIKAKAELHRFYKSGGRSCILESATGTGKTFMAAMFIKDLITMGKKVLILTDREELHDGSAQALVDLRIHPFLIDRRSKRLNISHSVYVAMCETLKRRIKGLDYLNWVRNTFDYIIIDECHKQSFNEFFEIEAFGNANILGLTATPKRTGKSRQLAMDYQAIIRTPKISEHIDAGNLARPIYVDPDLGVTSQGIKVSKINGEEDFNPQDADRAMDVHKVYEGLVNIMHNECKNLVTIIFCASSAGVIKTCKELNDAGIVAKYYISKPTEKIGAELHAIYGSMYSGERNRLKSDWKAGKFKVLVNLGVFTTGFDYPGIEAVIINRMTMSLALFLQMCGRGSRVIPNVKDSFIIVDMADNIERLGRWHEDREYSLKHFEGAKGAPPLKKCPKCRQECYASAKICDNILPTTYERCNFTFPVKDKKTIEVGFKVTAYKDLTWRDLTKEMKQKMTFEQLEDFRSLNKIPKGWLRYVAMETNRMDEYHSFVKTLV